jgi:hypothetical protein
VNLGSRYWRFRSKTYWLAENYASSVSDPHDCGDIHLLSRESAIVQLQDQWSNFCRDLILQSWRGGVTTLGGQPITVRTGPASNYDAMNTLRSTYSGRLSKGRYWEPKWFDAVEALDAAHRLQIENFSDISAGIGLTPSPLDEIRAVRNFIAHRGAQSVAQLQPFVATPTAKMVDQHVAAPTLGGALRFERWVAQLDIMARAAAS